VPAKKGGLVLPLIGDGRATPRRGAVGSMTSLVCAPICRGIKSALEFKSLRRWGHS